MKPSLHYLPELLDFVQGSVMTSSIGVIVADFRLLLLLLLMLFSDKMHLMLA